LPAIYRHRGGAVRIVKVAKFGGTSLASAEQIRKVCRIVASDAERRIVVVSAPGKRHPSDTKVTDLLIAAAKARLQGGSGRDEIRAVIARYDEIKRDLGLPQAVLDEIAANFHGLIDADRSDPGCFTDALKAAGEDNCARLFAQALRTDEGLDAHYLSPRDAGLLLSGEFGNAQVLPESYDNLARVLSQAPGVTVFPGFFGYTRDGHVATFPRGGSDITGAILAAAIHADVYENFTDVDSVFAADPRMVEHPRAITELTYQEMRELSYAGFGVFHEEAIQPAIHAEVPICICNTNRPDAPGTRIVPKRAQRAVQVTGIAGSDRFCSLYLSKYLMNREIGFFRRLLQIFEEEKLPIQHIPSGIDNVSVILREKNFSPEVEKRLCSRVAAELAPDSMTVERGLALVMIVGEGMHHALGVAGRAATALARAKVNIEMINQGSSEISMMFGVKADDHARAVRALYEEFIA
jgi:aspartate kinase